MQTTEEKSDTDIASIPKFRGILFIWDPAKQAYHSQLFAIQRESLVGFQHYYRRKISIEIKLRLAIVERLREFPSNEMTFGFSIRTQKDKNPQQFYVSSQKDLDQWFNHFKEFCYFTNFEEKYEIVRELEQGRISKIYLVKERETNVEFVAKIISKEVFIEFPHRIKQVNNEITIMSKLKGPQFVQLHEFYHTDKDLILVMEYMKGGTLFNCLLAKRRYTEKEGAIVIYSMMHALQQMHSRGFLHRDIKLENIFVPVKNNDLGIKIGDFDLSIEGDDKDQEKLSGTPGYIAPELFSKVPGCYSNKVDIFSSGVVLYALLLGSFPFRANNAKDMMEKNKKYEIRFSGPKWENLSADCRDLLEKMLAKDPILRLDCKGVLAHRWMRRNAENAKMSTKGDSRMIDSELRNDENVDETNLEDNEEYYSLRKTANLLTHRNNVEFTSRNVLHGCKTRSRGRNTHKLKIKITQIMEKEDSEYRNETKSQKIPPRIYHASGRSPMPSTNRRIPTNNMGSDSMSRSNNDSLISLTLHPFYKLSLASKSGVLSPPKRSMKREGKSFEVCSFEDLPQQQKVMPVCEAHSFDVPNDNYANAAITEFYKGRLFEAMKLMKPLPVKFLDHLN